MYSEGSLLGLTWSNSGEAPATPLSPEVLSLTSWVTSPTKGLSLESSHNLFQDPEFTREGSPR